MKQKINPHFVKMCKQGIAGAAMGIVAGFLLGIIIYFLQYPLVWIGMLLDGARNPNLWQQPGMWISAVMPGTLGMSFGAIIGGIFGSLYGLKN